jgi:hypothetical protein
MIALISRGYLVPPVSNRIERHLSLLLALGFAIYDAYAQAHAIPYRAPAWLIGIILAPWGESAYSAAKRLPEVVRKKIPKKSDN